MSRRGTYIQSIERLEAWLIRNNYRSYDPFDGLSSSIRPLTFGMKLPQQILQQFIRRNPFNLRPLLGIKPHTSTKGMGFLASGYLLRFQHTRDESYVEKSRECFEWLIEHSTKGYSGYCWGNSFDYVSRGFYLPKAAPTIVWSGLIGHHFIEGYRLLRDSRYLDVAHSVGEFILRDIARMPGKKGSCLSYVTHEKVAIHNANVIGGRLLAELYKETGSEEFLAVAHDAMEYTAGHQMSDGSWYYGEEEKFHWIDNWHTAYNLDAFLDFQFNTGSLEFAKEMSAGLDFYVNNFFLPNGAPKYYADRDYKYDIQSASQAIDTLLFFGRALHRKELIDLAARVADWTIEHMQDKTGYFFLWKNALFTNRTPTFHWGATTMLRALAHLLYTLEHEREVQHAA